MISPTWWSWLSPCVVTAPTDNCSSAAWSWLAKGWRSMIWRTWAGGSCACRAHNICGRACWNLTGWMPCNSENLGTHSCILWVDDVLESIWWQLHTHNILILISLPTTTYPQPINIDMFAIIYIINQAWSCLWWIVESYQPKPINNNSFCQQNIAQGYQKHCYKLKTTVGCKLFAISQKDFFWPYKSGSNLDIHVQSFNFGKIGWNFFNIHVELININDFALLPNHKLDNFQSFAHFGLNFFLPI